jgi:uncharacterized membrane protein
VSDFLIGLITVLVYIAVVATWFFSLADLFARNDLSGLSKGLWLLAIVFVPLFGVLLYFAVRPRKPVSEMWWNADRIYEQRDDTVALQVQTLAKLHREGAITDEEFVKMKERVVI